MLVESALSALKSSPTLNAIVKQLSNPPIAIATITTLGLTYIVYACIAPPRTNAPKFKSGSHWLFGSLPLFVNKNVGQKTHEAWQEISDEVGPVGWVKFMHINMFVITDGILARQICNSTSTDFKRANAVKATFGLFGRKSLMVIDDGEWREHRKLMTSGLSTTHLHHSLPQINASIDDFLVRWDEAERKGVPVDAYHDMSALALEALGRALLNVKFDLFGLGGAGNKYIESREDVEGIIKGIELRLVTMPPMWPFLKDSMKEKIVNVRALLSDLIEEKRKELQDKGVEKFSGETPDLVAALLTHPTKLPQEELIDELLLFFIAGHETSANSMTFTLARLCESPEALKSLEDEIITQLGPDTPPSTPDQIAHLKFLDGCIKESLRLHPVAGQFARHARKDVMLGGFLIPKGSEVGVNIRAMQRNPAFWPDEPEAFKPQRWLQPEAQKNPHYMPFAHGPQMCLGMRWANLEMRMVICRIVQRYKIELVPGQALEERTSLTTGLKDGVMLKLTRRV
ncbi:Thromboxane-A synthase [Rhizophlyctis rosea]|uniref:Thromboxane-A synthase n=1 Tax=Rhizophlyctis rosea TaxID=64517 RepID=A0AAD5SJ00_9FUNG|nr:Thromboxane-A synthase [Rhizophlyctis rosea]